MNVERGGDFRVQSDRATLERRMDLTGGYDNHPITTTARTRNAASYGERDSK